MKESKPTPLKYLTPGCLIEKTGFLSEDVCRVSCPLPTLPHCPQCWTLIRLPSDSLIVTLLLFPSFFPLLIHPRYFSTHFLMASLHLPLCIPQTLKHTHTNPISQYTLDLFFTVLLYCNMEIYLSTRPFIRQTDFHLSWDGTA